MVFNVAESDGRVWRVMALDEAELGTDRLVFGDAISVVGVLDIRAECDKAGRKRIGFNVQAKQVLFLRGRSVTRAAAMHESQPMSDGFARPRIG
jgi:hypothetical protein